MSTAVVVTDMATKQWIGRTDTDLPGGTRVHVGQWIDDGKSFHKWDSGVITRDKKIMRELEHMEEVEVREY